MQSAHAAAGALLINGSTGKKKNPDQLLLSPVCDVDVPLWLKGLEKNAAPHALNPRVWANRFLPSDALATFLATVISASFLLCLTRLRLLSLHTVDFVPSL